MPHQTENGYTRIADSLLDAMLRAELSKRELVILLAVIRRTYGFQKKEALITGPFLEQATGIRRQHVSTTVKNMVRRNILTCKTTSKGNLLGVNKAFFPRSTTVQEPSPKTGSTGVSQNRVNACPKTGSTVSPKTGHKRNKYINTPTGEERACVSPALWDEWEQHRRERKQTLTPTARNRQLKMLQRVKDNGGDPELVIRYSLEGGYQGLFEKQGFAQPNGGNHGRPERRGVVDVLNDALAADAAYEAQCCAGPAAGEDGSDLWPETLGRPLPGEPDA